MTQATKTLGETYDALARAWQSGDAGAFESLVKSVTVPSSMHKAPGEFVHDHHFPVLHDILHTVLEERVCLQKLADGMKALTSLDEFLFNALPQLHLKQRNLC